MDVVVAGAHGQIGLRLVRLLAARGDRVRGIIRNPAHAVALMAAGSEVLVLDLEEAGPSAVQEAIAGADAVVFTAGAGPGSGAARKWTLDVGGAVKLVDAARGAGVPRFVIVSSMSADHPERSDDDGFRVYLEAKGAADAVVRASGLQYTVVRPGRLTDAAGEGLVTVSTSGGEYGEIPRDDVAALLVAVLDTPATAGLTFDVITGDTPIAQATAALGVRA